MPADNSQIDTSIEIVTPENIAFKYRVAGPFPRLLAYAIDLMIRFGLCVAGAVVLMILLGAAGLPGLGVAGSLVIWFLLAWFYGGAFEALWNGQTPGKRVCQLRVVTEDGRPINGLQAVLRNVLRAVDMQPMPFFPLGVGVYLVGLVTAMLNDRFQRLGDIACGTMVVVEERPWSAEVIRVNEPEAIRLANQIPVWFQATRGLARALAVYVDRRMHFPVTRRLEIARHLGETLRDRFGLPADTDLDLLLCAAYHRTFITDRNATESEAAGAVAPPASAAELPTPDAQGAAVQEVLR